MIKLRWRTDFAARKWTSFSKIGPFQARVRCETRVETWQEFSLAEVVEQTSKEIAKMNGAGFLVEGERVKKRTRLVV